MGLEIPIPPGLKEDSFDHASEIIAKQFANDPFQRYAVLGDLEKAGKKELDYELNKEIFDMVIPGLVKGGARSLTVEGSGIASVWNLEPVTETYRPLPNDPPAVNELNALAHETLRPHIPPHCKGVLHLSLLANDRSHPSHDPSRNATVSDVMRPVIQMARENAWTIVLQATSEKSRDVYQHLGFKMVQELIVGKGKVDRQGRAKEGGEGCLLWAMMTPV